MDETTPVQHEMNDTVPTKSAPQANPIAKALPAQPPADMVGLLAEFADVGLVVDAARTVRDAGYERFDVHSPFPIHNIDKAMGAPRTILPWLTLGGGIAGFFAGLTLVWWTNATTAEGVATSFQGYKYLISGKPIFSLPANIPIIFETTVLFAAFAAVLGMFGLNKLPMLYNPLFHSERFRRATDDRFFVFILADDPAFDYRATADLLRDLGAAAVETVTDPGGPSLPDASDQKQDQDTPPDREAAMAAQSS